MSLAEDLSPASYKGVPFLVTSASLSGGRKDVKHSFPNSDTQVIEDLGLAPRSYSLEIVITGDNYIQVRDRIISTLEEGGAGPLVHPFYGRIENIAARTYTLSEDMTGLGAGRLSVSFEPSIGTGIPTATITTLNGVAAKNEELQAAVNADIVEGFSITESFTGNFTAGVDLLNGVVDAIEDKTDLLQAAADQIDAYTQQISDFSNNVLSLVQAPQALADSLGSLFDSIDNLYPSIEATAAVLAGFFDFGDDDVVLNVTTAGRAERAQNQAVVNASMQSMALGYAYLNAVQIDFENTDEIEAAADELEIQYQKIVDAGGLSDEAKSAMTDLRLDSQLFFDQQKLTVRQVIDVVTNLTSARLLSYRYYGTSADGEKIVTLNEAEDVAFMEGAVKVLSA